MIGQAGITYVGLLRLIRIKPIPILLQSINICMIELTILKNAGRNKSRQPWMTTALLKSCKKRSIKRGKSKTNFKLKMKLLDSLLDLL